MDYQHRLARDVELQSTAGVVAGLKFSAVPIPQSSPQGSHTIPPHQTSLHHTMATEDNDTTSESVGVEEAEDLIGEEEGGVVPVAEATGARLRPRPWATEAQFVYGVTRFDHGEIRFDCGGADLVAASLDSAVAGSNRKPSEQRKHNHLDLDGPVGGEITHSTAMAAVWRTRPSSAKVAHIACTAASTDTGAG
nr:unnamed protein product [Digitaria exilis]